MKTGDKFNHIQTGENKQDLIGTDCAQIQKRFNQALIKNGISTWFIHLETKTAYPVGCSESEISNGNEPVSIPNVSETQIERGIIYKDDISSYREMFERVYKGEKNVSGRYRRWSEKYQAYNWYEYQFTDVEYVDGVPAVALMTLRDISKEKLAEDQYLRQMNSSRQKDEKVLFYCRINLSNKKVEDEECSEQILEQMKEYHANSFSEHIDLIFQDVCLTEDEKKQLDDDELKKMYLSGKYELVLYYWAVLRKKQRPVWVRTECRLAERAETGDIIAFFYEWDMTQEHLTEGMLDRLASHSYERSAAIFIKPRRLRPIMELTAGYSPYWDNCDYDHGVDEYCEVNVAEKDQEMAKTSMYLDTILQRLKTEQSYQVQYDIIEKDGLPRRKMTEYSYLDQENGVILMSRTDIAIYEELRYVSEHDVLTGLYNREKMMKETLKMIKQHPEEEFIFAQVDISQFKQYNSAFGEKEGNRLLQFVAGLLLKSMVYYGDCVVGRVQADVFFICACGERANFIENLNKANEELKKYRSDYRIHLAIGVCFIKDNNISLEEASVRVAIAAHKCKSDVNCVYSIYDSEEEERRQQVFRVTNDMHNALKEKQFKVYLQPKYRLDTETPYGAEALVRWQHPKKGLISPGVFIPVFETNGFIADLDRYMWEEVCILLKKWKDAGRTLTPISVNVSRISLYNPNLVTILVELTKRYGVDPRLLNLEITESAYMSDQEMMKNTIRRLHEAGFIILMDDFGSGYSSLNTLKEFHIDILKIDMKFLPKERNVKRAEIILASVIHMAKWLGLDVIMEGVETEEEKSFLEGMNCDYIQGFYYACPMSVEQYELIYVDKNEPDSNYDIENDTSVTNKNESNQQIILVVNEKNSRDMILRLLENKYKLQTFSSSEDALAYMHHNPDKIGLILADDTIQGIRGIDFLEVCKMDMALKFLPFLMVTNNSAQEIRAKAIRLGVADYFVKPLSEEVIQAAVEKWMEVRLDHTLDAVKTALEQINDAAAIFRYHGMTGYLEYANHACYKLFHTTAKKTIGLSYDEIIHLIVSKEDQAKVFEMVETMYHKGAATTTYRTNNTNTGQAFWIQINGKMIESAEGLMAYVTYTDVTQMQQMLERERRLAFCQKLLISGQQLQDRISNVGKIIIEHYQANRIYLFEFDWDHNTMSSTYEYTAEGVEKETGEMQNIPVESIDIWMRQFEKGETISITDRESLKNDNSRSDEYNAMVAQNIQNLIAVPIMYDMHLYGYMGVHNMHQNVSDKEFVQNLAYFMSQEMHEREFENHLYHMSYTDALSALNNRNAYIRKMDQYKEERPKNAGVAFADVNALKVINDSLGHLSGDELIKSAAMFLCDYFPKEDIYRISGDEFVILMTDCEKTDFEDRQKRLLEDERIMEKRLISIGFDYKENPGNLVHMVERAEETMYVWKRQYHLQYYRLTEEGKNET